MWQAKCHGMGSCISNDARDFDLADKGDHSVRLQAMTFKVPPTPAMEEAIVSCSVFLGGRERQREFLKAKRV